MKETGQKNESHAAGKNVPHFISTRNACKLCAPLGASIAFRGIANCIPLIHGSQGCATYIRRYVISHFKEPVDIASSNFSETSAIFGGGDNLRTALMNVSRQYAPDVIGIASTCLSETMGDDVRLYLDQYKKEKKGEAVPVLIHASTPSYRGTHMEGYHEVVKATVEALAEGGPRTDTINIIPGFLSPEDLRHLKEIMSDFGIICTMFPDYSETLDGESWFDYQKLSEGGTAVESIRGMGRASATVQLGRSLAGEKSAAAYLENKFGVHPIVVGLPIGIRETDLFLNSLAEVSGKEIPLKYEKERGRLIDSYIDGHKYLFGKHAIVYGEMDFVASIASFLDEIGVIPTLCATGARTGHFEELVMSVIKHNRDHVQVVEDTDFATMLDTCIDMKTDIVIGSSKGYALSRKLHIPLVRIGFPIHDRIGGQRILHTGYRGTQQLFDRIVNTFIESAQNNSSVGYSYI